VGSRPGDVRTEADAAVRREKWSDPYSSTPTTSAENPGWIPRIERLFHPGRGRRHRRRSGSLAIEQFMAKHKQLVGRGYCRIDRPLEITTACSRRGAKFLAAVVEAGVLASIKASKGPTR